LIRLGAAGLLTALLPALFGCSSNGDGLPAVGTLERDRIEVVAEARAAEPYSSQGKAIS
jgi:hypothetical protein